MESYWWWIFLRQFGGVFLEGIEDISLRNSDDKVVDEIHEIKIESESQRVVLFKKAETRLDVANYLAGYNGC